MTIFMLGYFIGSPCRYHHLGL